MLTVLLMLLTTVISILYFIFAVLFIAGLIFIIRGIIIFIVSRVKRKKELMPCESNEIKPIRKKSAVKSIVIGIMLCVPLLLSMVPDTIIQETEKIPDNQPVAYYLNPNYDDYDKAALLLEQGADPDGVSYSWTPLTHVCYHGTERDEQMAALLLEHGANPNLANLYGETPLKLAIYRAKNATIVRLLLEYGADPNKINSDGSTPLQTAIHEKDEAIINLLIEYGAK